MGKEVTSTDYSGAGFTRLRLTEFLPYGPRDPYTAKWARTGDDARAYIASPKHAIPSSATAIATEMAGSPTRP